MAISGVGRNDPCPCGSGRKHKKCCLRNVEDRDAVRVRLRRAEGEAVDTLLTFVRNHLGWDYVQTAWAEFQLWDGSAGDPADQPEFESAFIPWMVFNWTPDPEAPDTDPAWPTESVGRHVLRTAGHRLSALARAFIEAACRAPFSFHAVLRVEPGRTIALRDILTHTEHVVLEQQATACVQAGDLLFARVVALPDGAVLCGCMPWVIPPRHHTRLLDVRDELAGDPGRLLRKDEVADLDVELREVLFELRDELLAPKLPELRNTDGDPLLPTKVRFALRCPPREAADALRSLTLDMPDDELLADAECDPGGEPRVVRIPWLKRGNAQHAQWDNTLLGSITIEEGRIVADVNSERRATMLRAEVEERLGERVRFEAAAHESVEHALRTHRSRAESPAARRRRAAQQELQRQPEVQEAVAEFYRRHWERWVDAPLPALNGSTPRTAAASPAGRERLEALLAEFARTRATLPDGRPTVDVAALRATLGLAR